MDEQLLYSAKQLRELDQQACAALGIDDYALMCRAGEAAFHHLRGVWPQAKTILVLCGSGNNGGDGYVLARLAHEAGMTSILCAAGRKPGVDTAAGQARAGFLKTGGTIDEFDEALCKQADVIVDGLLGTGLDRPIRDDSAALIQAVNESAVPVLALDIPSGLSADTGCVLGCAIKAEQTVSFIGLKQGLFTADAADYTGVLHFARLDVPETAYQTVSPTARVLNETLLADSLPPRRYNTHKGTYGHVLAVGGAPGMSGAIRLTTEAALRAGVGKVTLATQAAHAPFANLTRPELMVAAVESATDLEPLLQQATVLALGPGLGTTGWGKQLWPTGLASDKPLVLDADGLNLLAQNPQQRGRWILTPHPGEAARLLGSSTTEIQNDRFAAANALAERYQAIVVLKGSGTIIANPDGTPSFVCPYGNPGMASAGMGDVLTGIIAAFIAQGLPLLEAACAGVLAHALAGDRAADGHPRGLLASDVLAQLRYAVNP
ncbi:MAG TPA: NAD(P)H-hydrate dehydratase [Gammaproteobacteria bacterium]|nr:NAD(P)H-hydrate dehydratase [Gammaproteobacteria bacterium]